MKNAKIVPALLALVALIAVAGCNTPVKSGSSTDTSKPDTPPSLEAVMTHILAETQKGLEESANEAYNGQITALVAEASNGEIAVGEVSGKVTAINEVLNPFGYKVEDTATGTAIAQSTSADDLKTRFPLTKDEALSKTAVANFMYSALIEMWKDEAKKGEIPVARVKEVLEAMNKILQPFGYKVEDRYSDQVISKDADEGTLTTRFTLQTL